MEIKITLKTNEKLTKVVNPQFDVKGIFEKIEFNFPFIIIENWCVATSEIKYIIVI